MSVLITKTYQYILQTLYSNSKFNEMAAQHTFHKIMILSGVSFKIIKILEIYNFALFTNAFYNDKFDTFDNCKSMLNIDTIENIIKFLTYKDIAELATSEFTESFRNADFYYLINQIIYQTSNRNLLDRIINFPRRIIRK
ncbi:hypothetical protein H311_02861 [Anncaliia algerae PRA109]|nr:hypothetical protein H311_03554 [Anncaliia algerae PRA109]KCZ76147.1 hypothetical protein H311_02861 [Anncaliia algerae PRA109]